LPERLGAFAALLGPAEADIGECAIIEGGEVLTRALPLAPDDNCRDQGRPRT
jgi:hypothetical protein